MARRVNTRFVAILCMVVVGVVAAVVVAQLLLIREHADTYIQRGREAIRDQRWNDAVFDFSKAARLNSRDVDTQMQLGRALHALGATDQDKYAQEFQAYQRALEIDPNYMPAVEKLLEAYQMYVQFNPRARIYQDLIHYAQRAHELEPNNPRWAALPPELVVQKWLAGLETDQAEVVRALSDLRALMRQIPADSDLPYYLARAKIQQGQELTRQSASREQPPEATAAYAEALDAFEKLLGRSTPGPQDSNALMHYHFSEVLELLSQMDQSDPANGAKYLKRALAEMDRARALVKPSDPGQYATITKMAAEMAIRHNDPEKAMQIYRLLPDDATARVRLAGLLGRSAKTRPEGEQMLQSMLASLRDDPNHIVGLRALLMLELAHLRMSDYLETTNEADKRRLEEEIEASVDKLLTAMGSNVPLEVRALQVRFLVVMGKYVETIQTVSPLIANNQNASHDGLLLYYLALAYANSNQAARAITLMSDVVQRNPLDAAQRKFYARLLIASAPEQAAAQLEVLDRQAPDDPDLVLLHIQVLATDVEHNRAELKKYYVQLKESTAAEIGLKARVAVTMSDWDEALRLLNAKVAVDPKDVMAFRTLAIIYMQQGKKDLALAAATRGVAANPDSKDLKLLIPSIKGEDPKIIEHLREELAKQEPDPVQRELELAGIAQQRSDLVGSEQHLKAAEQAAPDNPRVWNALFLFYLHNGRLDKAAPYVPKLASVNYDKADGKVCQYLMARSRGDVRLALDIARQLTQDKPEFAFSWVALGDALQAQGSYDLAMAQYGAALERQANNFDAYNGLISCLYALHKPSEALRYINEALAKLPDNAALRDLLITHQLRYGNVADAIAVLQQEIRRSPDSPGLYAALGSLYIRAAKMLNANGQHDEAVRLLQQSVNMMGSVVGQWPDEASLYLEMANATEALGEPGDAELVLLTWAKRDAWRLRPEPHMKLSELYESVGQKDAAESQLRTALVRSDYRVDLQLALASLWTEHKKFDEALQLLRAVNADRPDVREKVITVLLVAGRFKDAEAQLKADLEQHPPDSARLLSIWAKMLLDREQFAAAMDRASQALALEPGNVNALYCRAWSRLRVDPPDTTGALEDLKHLRQVAPDNTQIRLQMAAVYIRLDMPDEAADELQSALYAEPANKTARIMLVQIYGSGPHPRLTQVLRLLQEVESKPPFDKDPDIFQSEAVVLGDMNDLPAALAKSDLALSLDPKNPVLIQTHVDLLLRAGRYPDVMDQTARLEEKLKSSWWALLDRGVAEQHLGDSASAIDDTSKSMATAATAGDPTALNRVAQAIAHEISIDQAISAISPYTKDRPTAKLTLTLLYHRKGDEAAALATIQDVIAGADRLSRPEQLAVYTTAAQLYQTVKPHPLVDKAYDALQRWLKLDPNSVDALNNLAWLMVDSYSPPRVQEGLQYAQRAMDLVSQTGRTDPSVLDTRGWLLILSGSPAQGVELINRALETKVSPEEYLHLGEGYLRLQYPADAKKQARLGMDLLGKLPQQEQDTQLQTKLKDLDARCDEMIKAKQETKVP